jgi:hypothetical protein
MILCLLAIPHLRVCASSVRVVSCWKTIDTASIDDLLLFAMKYLTIRSWLLSLG